MLTCVLTETYKILVGKSLLDVRKGIDSSTQWIGVYRPVLHKDYNVYIDFEHKLYINVGNYAIHGWYGYD